MIVGCWGEDKTCKTTLALTFPKPMVVMEFDIGGYARAIHRFKKEQEAGLIKYEAYAMPMQFGTFDPKSLELRPSKLIVGMKELFYRWASSYIQHLQSKEVATIVVDTATLLYSINCDAYLQEKQEIQFDARGQLLPNEKLRVQLTQIEYREPNNRMRGIIYNAKAAGKNLVLVHHARDEYKPILQKDGSIATSATGKRERAGFSTLGDSADLIVHTYTKPEPELSEGKPILVNGKAKTKLVPYCEVDLAEALDMVGMHFREPNYDLLSKTIAMVKGIALP